MISDYFAVQGKKKNCGYGIRWNDIHLEFYPCRLDKDRKERELNTKEKDKRPVGNFGGSFVRSFILLLILYPSHGEYPPHCFSPHVRPTIFSTGTIRRQSNKSRREMQIGKYTRYNSRRSHLIRRFDSFCDNFIAQNYINCTIAS